MTEHVSAAHARFMRGSAQKFRLVVNQIRGRKVPEALGILQLSRKRVSKSLEALLRSAVANAENLKPEIDVDELYIAEAFVNPGPSLPPRIRPQPMGRAFPIIKRTSHITVKLAERDV
jgi:large subunit ribosomal protein L22